MLNENLFLVVVVPLVVYQVTMGFTVRLEFG